MDVLRENIGLLQLPQDDYYYEDEDYLNEFSLPWKKKSRWQRFKDAVKRNKGKIAAGAGILGAGALGGDYFLYRKGKSYFAKLIKKENPDIIYDEKKDQFTDKNGDAMLKVRYRPFGTGDEIRLTNSDQTQKFGLPISRINTAKRLLGLNKSQS